MLLCFPARAPRTPFHLSFNFASQIEALLRREIGGLWLLQVPSLLPTQVIKRFRLVVVVCVSGDFLSDVAFVLDVVGFRILCLCFLIYLSFS